jgi:hypothetical protein
MFAFIEKLTPAICQANANVTFVFGDNLIKKGEAGQAVIRKEQNAFGVPTKRLPSMTPDAFYSDLDEEYRFTRIALKYLWSIHINGGNITLPKQKIGSGLAELQKRSPKIAKMIDDFYMAAEQAESFEVLIPGGQQTLSLE